MNEKYLNDTGFAQYDTLIKAYINSVSGNTTGVRIVTLSAAPTSSTTTYTIDGITTAFKVGDEAFYSGKVYKLYELTTSGNNTTATWKEIYIKPSSSVVAITTDTSSSCSITGAANSGTSETIVYTNSSGSTLVVTVPTTYATPDGAAIEITCADGGYCEVNYLNINGTIYARGI